MKSGKAFRSLAFSLPELLIVVVVLAVLAAVALPALLRSKSPSRRIPCVSNLKNIGLAFRIYAVDNGDQFPAPALSNEVAVAQLSAAAHFAFLSNELSTPKLLHCPADKGRAEARNFLQLSRDNISYFSSLNADEAQTQLWLAGDRNLMINGKPAEPGQMLVSTNDEVGWTREIHAEFGYIVMVDGSVQNFGTNRLQQALKDAGSTNLLLFP